MGLLRELVDRMGVALLLVTHDPSCAAMADWGIRLRDGRVVGEPVVWKLLRRDRIAA